MQKKTWFLTALYRKETRKTIVFQTNKEARSRHPTLDVFEKTTILFIIDSLPFACILFHEINLLTLALYRYVTLMMFCRTERSNFSQNSSIALRDLDVLLVTLSCSCLSRIFSIEAKYCNQFEIFLNFDIWNLYTFIPYICISKIY